MPDNKVLILEDREEGQGYKELLESRLKIEAFWAKNEGEAISIVESNFIKVAVLDQRLEADVLGTKVFEKIRKLQPRLLAIMLSRQATEEDLGRSVDLGYFKYLNKRDILELPEIVMDALEKANIELLKSRTDTSRHLIASFRNGFFVWQKYQVFLVSRSLIDSEFIFEDRWSQLITLEAGQQFNRELGFDMETSVVLETKSSVELETKYSLKLEGLKNSLGSDLSSKAGFEVKSSESQRFAKKVKFGEVWTGPTIPTEVGKEYLASKSYEVNQVYEKYQNILEILCPYCNTSETFSVISYAPTRKVRRRQIDYFNTGRKQVIDTGTVTK